MSKWTFRTLKAFLLGVMNERDKRYDQRFEASQKGIETALLAVKESGAQALAAADRAVSKAEIASEKRFEGVNEFRNTLADQQRTLMPRTEAEIKFAALAERCDSLEKTISSGKDAGAGVKAGWGYAVGFVMLVLFLFEKFSK